MILFDAVTKLFDERPALSGVSFSIERGELAFVTGPSGAGKTTLLKLVYLAERPDSGTISVDGTDIGSLKESKIPYLRRRIGVVFQDFKLLDRTVFENVALALRIRGTDLKHVNEALKMVGLRHKADSFPRSLSGGEQQRVVIARAIVGEPAVLLADEPTGNLDLDTARDIMDIFKEINARGTTVLVATHNRELYRESGRRIFRLADGNLTVSGNEFLSV